MATVLSFERHPVDPASVDAFRALLDEALALMRSKSGVLWADGARALDDDPSYVVLSEWRTAADLDAWEASEDAHRLRDEAELLLRGEVTRRRFSGRTVQ